MNLLRYLLEENTLGRIFNLLGEPVDNMEYVGTGNRLPIHREAPAYEDQETSTEILETGIKVVDLIAPYAKGWKDRTVWWCRSW